MGNVLLLAATAAVTVACYWARGIAGLAGMAFAFFLPLRVLRVLVWSMWGRLLPWLRANATPRSWAMSLLAAWGGLGVLFWLASPQVVGTLQFPIPMWLRVVGAVLIAGGAALSAWAQWAIGLDTTMLIPAYLGKRWEARPGWSQWDPMPCWRTRCSWANG